MSRHRLGDRFRLLLYRSILRRQSRPAILLAAILLGLWYGQSTGRLPWPKHPAETWTLAGGLVALASAGFLWVAPFFAYVQPRNDHLRLQTPVFRLKISYRRIQSIRPIIIATLYPPEYLRGSDLRLLAPFMGATALAIDLRSYPAHPIFLGLFFQRLFFAPDHEGFLLLVENWIELSSQLAVRLDSWRGSSAGRPMAPPRDAAAILAQKPGRRKR